MRIALDAMGGDAAPGINIDGALQALKALPEVEVVLVGDRATLEPLVEEHGDLGSRLQIIGSTGFVGMEEKPTEALRKKPDCSIAICWKMMAAKEVNAVISAGNTGGVVAAGLRTRLFLKGVKRPGIAVVLPTSSGQTVLMDVGANPGARPEHLAQYAVMGSVFAREVLGIAQPRVGLMNIGSEDGKGTDLVRETHDLIQRTSLGSAYIGNVEGRGLYAGEADVVICEGFVGNVVLKVSEGMASMMMRMLAGTVVSSLSAEKDKALQAFQQAGRVFEYNETGGAPLLGVDGIALICHGSSDPKAILNAIRTACKLQDRRVNQQMVEQLNASPIAAS